MASGGLSTQRILTGRITKSSVRATTPRKDSNKARPTSQTKTKSVPKYGWCPLCPFGRLVRKSFNAITNPGKAGRYYFECSEKNVPADGPEGQGIVKGRKPCDYFEELDEDPLLKVPPTPSKVPMCPQCRIGRLVEKRRNPFSYKERWRECDRKGAGERPCDFRQELTGIGAAAKGLAVEALDVVDEQPRPSSKCQNAPASPSSFLRRRQLPDIAEPADPQDETDDNLPTTPSKASGVQQPIDDQDSQTFSDLDLDSEDEKHIINLTITHADRPSPPTRTAKSSPGTSTSSTMRAESSVKSSPGLPLLSPEPYCPRCFVGQRVMRPTISNKNGNQGREHMICSRRATGDCDYFGWVDEWVPPQHGYCPECLYGRRVFHVTSSASRRNPGRPYFTCSAAKKQASVCQYYEFADETDPPPIENSNHMNCECEVLARRRYRDTGAPYSSCAAGRCSFVRQAVLPWADSSNDHPPEKIKETT